MSTWRLDAYVAPEHVRYDEADFGAFMRQLEDIESQVMRDDWPEYMASNGDIVPLEIKNQPWKRKTTYFRQTNIGKFRLYRSYGTAIPMINVLREERTQSVYTWAAGYRVDDDDIEAASHTGFPIEPELIQGVREAAEQTLDDLIWYGDKSIGMDGFINHPEFLYSYSPVPFNSLAPDPTVILSTMNAVASLTAQQTYQIEKPSRLLMPGSVYDYLSSTRLSSPSDRTILEQYVRSSRFITGMDAIKVCYKLETAAPSGNPLMIWYTPDARKVKAMITQELTWKPFERKALGYERIATFKYAGIRAYRPWSVHVLEIPLT